MNDVIVNIGWLGKVLLNSGMKSEQIPELWGVLF